jgi:type III restriction enzyme
VRFELREFQETAVGQLLNMLGNARYGARTRPQAVGLTATTGAGKTVIATALIERLLLGSDDGTTAPDPGGVFLWMTDLPQLNAQTRAKIFDASGRLRLNQLVVLENSFTQDSLAPGRVYFLNTQKLGAKSDLVKSGPLSKRSYTFWEVVQNTIEADGRTLYLIVDEAHRGMTESRDQSKINAANSIIQRFIKGYPEEAMAAVPLVFGISATLARFDKLVENTGRAVDRWVVPNEDVRASGLIKERTLTDVSADKNRDVPALLRLAIETWNRSTRHWASYHARFSATNGGEPLVVPALIVQVENEDPEGVADRRVTKTDLGAVMEAVSAVAGALPDRAFVHAFGAAADLTIEGRNIRYLEASQITADESARVVFFKSGLGTGWDCPRAEVMFSFRRAEDPTSIAQTIGRMVRTPLARFIDEEESLNLAHVFLPNYNEKEVGKVIDILNASGGGAIAESMTPLSSVTVLPRRSAPEGLVAAIEAVPSYLVPTIRERQDVRRLVDLARALSKHEIDLDAYAREREGLADFLGTKRTALASNAAFKKAVNAEGQKVTIARVEWAVFAAAKATATMLQIPASAATAALLFAQAKRALSGDAAVAYWKARVAKDPAAATSARFEAYALSQREDVMRELNDYSTKRIDALFAAYGLAIKGRELPEQRVYDEIRGRAAEPSLADIHLPEEIVVTLGESAWPKHLYADNDHLAHLSFKSAWERETLNEELAKPEVVAWLRNLPTERWAVRIPWRDKNVWRPFYPDFLLVRNEGERFIVDILDPHDYSRADALGKAHGLSSYARDHGLRLGHVDMIAKVEGRLRRLHLEQEETRRAIDNAKSQGELLGLYAAAYATPYDEGLAMAAERLEGLN